VESLLMVTLDYFRTTAARRHVRRLQGPRGIAPNRLRRHFGLTPEVIWGLKALFPNTRNWCRVWFLRVST